MMDNELTIEKFKINERLQGLETQVALLRQSVDELKVSKNEVHEHIIQTLRELDKKFHGDGDNEGIIIRLNDLWKAEQSRKRHYTIIYTAVIALAVQQVWRYFHVTNELETLRNEIIVKNKSK